MMFFPNFREKSFDRWLERATGGQWVSDRRYLYFSPWREEPKSIELTTHFEVVKLEYGKFSVDWRGQTNGRMVLTLEGAVLHRDIGYFSNDPTDSFLERLDHNTVSFWTTYGGQSYREEVRYLGDDLRLRQTVGWKEGTDQMVLAGQYVERRI